MANLKTLAQAHQLYLLESNVDDNYWAEWQDYLLVDIPLTTQNFSYSVSYGDSDEALAIAMYSKEDVCLCYKKDDQIIIEQLPDDCQSEDGSETLSMN